MPSPRLAVVHVLIAAAAVIGLSGALVESAGPDATAAPIAMAASTCAFTGMEASHPSSHAGMAMPTAAACTAFRPAISMRGWSAIASSTVKGHPASSSIRGGVKTWWQSKNGRPGHFKTQTLTLRSSARQLVSGLQYQPAKGRGVIGKFDVRLSSDGRKYGRVVATGRWQNNGMVKQIAWTPAKVRAVKITIRSVSPSRSKSVTAADLVLTGVQPAGSTMGGTPSTGTPAGGSSTPSSAPATSPTTGSSAGTGSAPSPQSAISGQWGPTIAFPLVPVAVAAIPNDRLVVWAADEVTSFNSSVNGATQTAVLDLKTGAVTASTVSNTGHNMFCPGISLLADGRVLVTGGIGDQETSIYDPATNSWSAGPRLNIGRGYNGQTTLSDGRAFTIGGSWSGGVADKLGEVWTPGASAWQVLPNVTTADMLTGDPDATKRDNHAWLIASSNGTALQAGPSKQMNWISTAGDGAVLPAGVRGDAGDQMNGNAVLFDVNKVLTVGGAPDYTDSQSVATADVLDLSAGYGKPVSVSSTAPLQHARSFANSVVLPDGEVLTVGGMQPAVTFSDTGSVLTPELWSPATGTWREMADEAEPRNYHSIAVLLPDGTVFSGGGGLCGTCATNHPTGQIFSPPYLFNADGALATRPTISGAPASVQPGGSITVSVSSDASSFVLVRAGESTHAVDNDQRRVPLTITGRSGGNVTLAIPSDTGVVLPGRYMLFALTAAGVPSIAAPITIGLGQ